MSIAYDARLVELFSSRLEETFLLARYGKANATIASGKIMAAILGRFRHIARVNIAQSSRVLGTEEGLMNVTMAFAAGVWSDQRWTRHRL